jgi:hypothetical protein
VVGEEQSLYLFGGEEAVFGYRLQYGLVSFAQQPGQLGQARGSPAPAAFRTTH